MVVRLQRGDNLIICSRFVLSLHNLHFVVTDTFQDILQGPTGVMIMQPEHFLHGSTTARSKLGLIVSTSFQAL